MPTKTPKKPTNQVDPTEAPEDQVPAIIAKYIRTTDAGLSISQEMPFEDWLKGAPIYETLFRKAQWFWGDYLIQGEKLYGEAHAQAVGEYKEGHIDNVVSICARFDHARRRPNLSFSHHKAAASLHPSDADKVLLEAERMRWTASDVGREVAKIHALSGTKPKPGRKKKGVVFSPQSEKTDPPTLDGHLKLELKQGEKALTWNGYPLSTANRLVYQGPELLDAFEADEAAHYHEFQHKEALMNWLEEHNFTRKEGDEPCQPLLASAILPVGSNGASVVQPDAAPNSSQPASPAPASAPSELQKVAEQPKGQPEPPRSTHNYPLFELMSREHGLTLMESELDEIIDIAAGLRTADLSTNGAPPAAPAIQKSPVEAAEELILAFNAQSEVVDWKALPELSRKKWLGRLLRRADDLIDILQNNAPAPRK